MLAELLNLCPSLKNKTILLREKFIVLAHGFKFELTDNLHRVQALPLVVTVSSSGGSRPCYRRFLIGSWTVTKSLANEGTLSLC